MGLFLRLHPIGGDVLQLPAMDAVRMPDSERNVTRPRSVKGQGEAMVARNLVGFRPMA